MPKISALSVVVLVFFAVLLGGALSSVLISNNANANQSLNNIITRSISVVDNQGRRRAGIGFEDDNPVLFFNDKKGNTRAYITVSETGPILVFRNSKHEMQLYIESSEDGSSSIGLMAGNKKQRLMILYSPKQGPALGLYDENKYPRAVISVTHDDPSVILCDQDKKPAIAMLNRKGEGSILSIWNSNNDPAVSLAVKGDKPGLFMYQQPRTGLLFNTAGGRPALALMNHGTPVWSATGEVPSAPELPPTDDIMRELMR